MKKSPSFLLLLTIWAITLVAYMPPNIKTINIKTSALCTQCKQLIETKFNSTKGIKKVNLDLVTNILMVKYNSNIITAESIKAQLVARGYNADSLQRDSLAYINLPLCCKTNLH
jgi:mercuric ion binding protein